MYEYYRATFISVIFVGIFTREYIKHMKYINIYDLK